MTAVKGGPLGGEAGGGGKAGGGVASTYRLARLSGSVGVHPKPPSMNALMMNIAAPVPQSRNLMFDPRVIRGTTLPRIKAVIPESIPEKKPTERKRRRKPAPPSTPVPVDGRKHMDIQTDVYLEEIVDRISEYDVDTQTDEFLDRPATPLFIPQKPGPDVGTQIEEGDLFNFDEEVEPILEVLVGRTLEQAWMEVTEEKQLAELHAHQEHFEKIRQAELVATQRMEFAEWRKREEKKRRVEQERKRLEDERMLKEKLEIQKFAREHLKKMTDAVVSYLDSAGYFYDPVEREVETMFMPSLQEAMLKELNKTACARATLHCIAEAAVTAKDVRAQKTVNEIMKSIVGVIESKLTELSILNAEDVMRDVMNVVEVTTTEMRLGAHETMAAVLDFFETAQYIIGIEVMGVMKRVLATQEQERIVKSEIKDILERVIAYQIAEAELQEVLQATVDQEVQEAEAAAVDQVLAEALARQCK